MYLVMASIGPDYLRTDVALIIDQGKRNVLLVCNGSGAQPSPYSSSNFEIKFQQRGCQMIKESIARQTSTMFGDGKRLMSLDVFRGATMAAMILVNNSSIGQETFAPLRHAKWHGWTFADLVFPFFLWIIGVSMAFSFARRIDEGVNRHQLMLHTLRRAALLFGIGLLLNGFPRFNLETIRIPGVLQRIAVCYLVGAAIFIYTSWRAQVYWIIGLSTTYWMMMTLIPVPGYGPGVLNQIGNFSQYVDNLLLPGHLLTNGWDPEGLVSTLPAITNLLFGALCGTLLQREDVDAREKTIWMFVWGLVLVALAGFLNHFMPINKRLWTPPYELLTSGCALFVFASCYWFIDVLNKKDWSGPLLIYGANPILIYVASSLFAKLLSLIGMSTRLYAGLLEVMTSPIMVSLLYAMMHVSAMYAMAWFLFKHRLFLRL